MVRPARRRDTATRLSRRPPSRWRVSSNPATQGLPRRWERFDEWYNFRDYTDGSVRVLARLDEATYDAGATAMGDDHPIAWCHAFDGGRAFYTGMGHTDASTRSRSPFHLLGGIEQVAGVARFNCGTD